MEGHGRSPLVGTPHETSRVGKTHALSILYLNRCTLLSEHSFHILAYERIPFITFTDIFSFFFSVYVGLMFGEFKDSFILSRPETRTRPNTSASLAPSYMVDLSNKRLSNLFRRNAESIVNDSQEVIQLKPSRHPLLNK